MSRALDRRLIALESGHQTQALSAWQTILREISDAGLDALGALLTEYEADPTAPAVMTGCAQILKDFAPDAETLDRWLIPSCVQ